MPLIPLTGFSWSRPKNKTLFWHVTFSGLRTTKLSKSQQWANSVQHSITLLRCFVLSHRPLHSFPNPVDSTNCKLKMHCPVLKQFHMSIKACLTFSRGSTQACVSANDNDIRFVLYYYYSVYWLIICSSANNHSYKSSFKEGNDS